MNSELEYERKATAMRLRLVEDMGRALRKRDSSPSSMRAGAIGWLSRRLNLIAEELVERTRLLDLMR